MANEENDHLTKTTTEPAPESTDPLIVPREIVESLPDDVRQVVITASVEWDAPLPPPGILRAYEDSHPGTAERIIALMERQVDHRIDCERSAVRSFNSGKIFGHVYSVLALIAAAFIAVNGQPGISIIFLGTGVAGYLKGLFRFLSSLSRKGDD